MKKIALSAILVFFITNTYADLDALRQAELQGEREERISANKAKAAAAAKRKAQLDAIAKKEAKKEAKEERMYQDYMADKKKRSGI